MPHPKITCTVWAYCSACLDFFKMALIIHYNFYQSIYLVAQQNRTLPFALCTMYLHLQLLHRAHLWICKNFYAILQSALGHVLYTCAYRYKDLRQIRKLAGVKKACQFDSGAKVTLEGFVITINADWKFTSKTLWDIIINWLTTHLAIFNVLLI